MNAPTNQPLSLPTKPHTPRWRSLSTRLSLSTAVIVLLGVWSLAFYAGHELQQDMQALLGAQQLSTVSIVANEVNQGMAERVRAVDIYAAQLAPLMTGPPAALQAQLDQRPLLQRLFNGGVVVLAGDGTALADAPRLAGRSGQNYRNDPDVAAVLRGAKTTVSRPAIGRVLNASAFAIIAPLHDTQGRVVGALMGLTNLGLPNFLDVIGKADFGKTGGFLLVAPQHGLVITATDKTRVMEPVSAPGVIPPIDRFLQGYEGTAVYVNARGVEVLTSARRVPAAGWIVASKLPTAEAFAPVRAMQQRIVLATLGLTLLAAALTGWITRRQLAPMRAAAQALAAQASTQQPMQPLPAGRQDEVGALISGFNQVLAALVTREAQLRSSDTALRSISQGVIVTGPDRLIVLANAAFTDITGYSAQEILGRDCTFLSGPGTDPLTVAAIRQALAGATRFAGEFLNYRKDGTPFWNDLTISPVFDAQGDLIQLIGVTRNISTRRAAELQLRRQESLLAQAEAMAGFGRWDWNLAADSATWSDALYRLYGRARADGVPAFEAWQETIHPEDHARLAGCIQTALAGATVYSIEFRIFAKDTGQLRYIESRGSSVADANGKPTHIGGIDWDITERRQASAELMQSEQRFKALTALSADWFWEQDAEFRFVRMDGDMELNTGVSAVGLLGLARWDIPTLNLSASDWDAHKADLRAHRPFRNFEMRRPDQDGRSHWVSISGEAIFDAQGSFAGYRGVGSDITARKEADLALQASLRDKEALLKEVHHRVKNNLQVVTSLLRLEAGRSGHAPTKAVLAEMQGRIRAMAQLHESLYRSGVFATVDLAGYVKGLATQAVRILTGREGSVRLQLGLAALTVTMDQAMPIGLLANEMISNAFKHGFAEGRSGDLNITLAPLPDGVRWRLCVSDTGAGLPADFAARRGQSLGLQLARDLAVQAGGVLDIGPGPQAVFALDFTPARAHAAPARPAA